MRRWIGRLRKSEEGQISIMISMMIMTFILLFAFVINTGMLVNAKINLQNAADMAAYSGAAVQARQLNQISYLNYEMRRQWKKFLFRIYVVGNVSRDNFPRSPSSGGNSDYYWTNPNDPSGHISVPATCVIFNAQDNFCRNATLPATPLPPANPFDSISTALSNSLQAIEQIRQNNCSSIASTNQILNTYWLYNTDPDLYYGFELPRGGADYTNNYNLVRGLITGLGIVPKELTLKFRIQTLQAYLNAPPHSGLNLSTTQGLQNGQDPPLNERAIQAFYSAYYTLGDHTFDSSQVSLDELINSSLMLKLNPITASFDTFAFTHYVPPPDGNPHDCTLQLQTIPVTAQLTLGFAKDPTILTYYAVRLRAKAHLLFSPLGDLDLKAYSAAQPFGSRIGPPSPAGGGAAANGASNIFFVSPGGARNTGAPTPNPGTGNLPNLPVLAGDSGTPGRGSGWDNGVVLGTMAQYMNGGGGIITSLTEGNLQEGYRMAMAPNPWEGNKYNILNNFADNFVQNFDQSETATLWAPLFTEDKMATAGDQLASEMDLLFGTQNSVAASMKSVLQAGLTRYINQEMGQQNQNELGETKHLAKIWNPLMRSGGSPVTGDPNLFMTDETSIKSSWNTGNDSNLQQLGRVGYSVKFVSFSTLRKKTVTTDGANTWTNDFSLDTEADQDTKEIKH